MEIITSNKLSSLIEQYKRFSEEILPELIKRLILSSCHDNLSSIRIPDKDDIWAPGFDGIVECDKHTLYVCEGKSIWEFGTNHDSLQKINDDYQKRVNNPLGINIAETSFYLVIPKIWAFNKEGKSITDWENEKQKDGWKDIKVYDASILSDWINSEPAVCAWLNEQYYHESLNFSSVNKAWHIFSNKTKPCFTEKMFIEDREREKDFFLSLFNTKNDQRSIIIKGESLIDAQGFVLVSLLQDNNLKGNTIVINDKKTYNTISNEVNHKLLFLNFYFEGDLNSDDNTVILAFNKEAVSIKENIKLTPLFRDHYVKALIDMGFSEGEASNLFSSTHGNLRSLIRTIPGTTIDSQPDWAVDSEKHLLIPLLFLHHFNRQGNEIIVSMLSEHKYSEIEKKYKDFLQKEDSPVKEVEGDYVLVNYDEAWSVLKPQPSDSSYNLLSNTILEILDEINQRNSCSWLNVSTRPKNQFTYLIQNLIYFSIDNESSHEIQCTIQKILEYAYYNNTQEIVLSNLYLLAEATPQTVLDFIQDDLKNEDGIINSIFNSAEVNSKYIYILFALDILALDDDTNIDACKILFDLYSRNLKYSYKNSPKESLLSTLYIYNTHGTLSLKQKCELINSFINQNVDLGVKLAIELINKRSLIITHRHKQYKEQIILSSDSYLTLETIASNIFNIIKKERNVLYILELIKCYNRLKPQFWLKQIETFTSNNYSIEELIKLNFAFRQNLFRIKTFNDNIFNCYIEAFDLWVNKTSITTPLYSNFWMFNNFDDCPAEELLPYQKKYEKVFEECLKLRQNALKNLLENFSLQQGIFELLKFLNHDSRWGEIFTIISDKDILLQICLKLIEIDKKKILYGIIDSLNKDQAKNIFDGLSYNIQLELLSSIQREDISDWLVLEEFKKAYWEHRFIYKFNSKDYPEILKYNPNALIYHCYKLAQQNVNDNIATVKKVLSEIYKSNNKQGINLLDNIVEIIDEKYYDDEWADICINLYKNHYISKIPNCINKYFFLHPDLFIQYLIKFKQKYYPDSNVDYSTSESDLSDTLSDFIDITYDFDSINLSDDFDLPDIAYRNYEQFKTFCDLLYSNSQMYLLGNILGKAKKDNDGYSPHIFVRNYIEEKNTDDLDEYVQASLITNLGWRIVSDGQDRFALASMYKETAKQLKIQSPRTSKILMKIFEYLTKEGQEDHKISELQ